MTGVFPWSFFGLVLPVQEIFVLPWLLYSAQNKIFVSSSYTISIHLSLSSSKLGRQLCCVACLLVYVSGVNYDDVDDGLVIPFTFCLGCPPTLGQEKTLLATEFSSLFIKVQYQRWVNT